MNFFRLFIMVVVGSSLSVWSSESIRVRDPLLESCTCLEARYKYWMQFTGVYNNFEDPVYHYLNTGSMWTCELCEEDPIWANNSLCNCTVAQDWFLATYPELNQTAATAFSYWLATNPHGHNKLSWRCNYCIPPRDPRTDWYGLKGYCGDDRCEPGEYCASPSSYAGDNCTADCGACYEDKPYISLPMECQCWQARFNYWNQYKDVYYAHIDPVHHYLFWGHREGKEWNCSACNNNPLSVFDDSANCTDAAQKYINTYFPGSSIVTVKNAWRVWKETYASGGMFAWHANLCFNGPVSFDKCGDGHCSDDENCAWCPKDCKECHNNTEPPPKTTTKTTDKTTIMIIGAVVANVCFIAILSFVVLLLVSKQRKLRGTSDHDMVRVRLLPLRDDIPEPSAPDIDLTDL